LEDCERAVRELRPRVDWLVVQLHWGTELCQLPSPAQRRRARRLVEAGADLILGHHPHVLQPMEMIDGVPVFYSLGNFLFSDMYWRGKGPQGQPFASRYRLHPLSRLTGWAEVVLTRGGPTTARLHPARLGRDLAVVPEDTAERRRQWEGLCRSLARPDYESAYEAEELLAVARLRWQDAWQSLPRRLELLLFRCGLLPRAVEGT
jgi:poly-gamma-glutamate capsule biosynthesis protein CapA/YwtB (metallophosphatase superfamily)